jgi:hypothetical protein
MSRVEVARLQDVPAHETLVVIINCSTKWVSTLALLSAVEMTSWPVLLIDCESTDGSKAHFESVARERNISFYWLRWPFRPHPAALDQLFAEVLSERVLLLDSDAEIRSREVTLAMSAALASDTTAYGSGFLQGPEWLAPPLHRLPVKKGYFAERMWIPLTLLRVEPVRTALTAGVSFAVRRPYYEVTFAPRFSYWLGQRFRVPVLRHFPFPQIGAPNYEGRIPDGIAPAFVEFDTGADLHHHMTRTGFVFAECDRELLHNVYHHHGVTRDKSAHLFRRIARRIGLVSPHSEAMHSEAETIARTRLRDAYNFTSV